jgi:hypothetical protein
LVGVKKRWPTASMLQVKITGPRSKLATLNVNLFWFMDRNLS